MHHDLQLAITLVVGLGVIAQWLAWRLRVPAIVLFSIAGLIAGPVLGIIEPHTDFGAVYKPVISLAVAVILFEGGMTLRIHEFHEAASGVKRLVTLGSLMAFSLGSLAAHGIGNLSWPTSLVFGAITVVTGPTVIIPLLRQSSLNRRSASYLKWEGIINDPVGALAAVLIFQFFVYSGSGDALDSVLLGLGKAIACGLVIGFGMARLIGWAFSRAHVPEFLKAPVALGAVLGAFTISNMFQAEAGLLTVTIMGMVLGNLELPGMEEMRKFKENITILLVASVFVMLTADLNPDILFHLDWKTILLIVSMLVLVRPLAIFISTLFSEVHWRDRILLGWIAPRGIVAVAVAGLFGPEMMESGYEDAELLLPLIFVLVLATVSLHGFTIGFLARRLKLTTESDGVLIVGASPWATDLAEALIKKLDMKVTLVDSSWHRLREARLGGVEVLYGEVLSDELQQSLELNGVSCMLSATSNDAYNALVCRSFSGRLEHDRVFQLPMYAPDEVGKGAKRAVAKPVAGITAFSDSAVYEELWRRRNQGWQFYKTKLTETYTYEHFLDDLPEEFYAIGVKRETGRLVFHAPSHPIKPKAGETVIYYAPKKPASEGARGKSQPKDPEPSAEAKLRDAAAT